MKFLIDAQLPRRLADWLIAAGCDAVHTLDLPDGNRTTDQQLTERADREQRIVVTKDADFVDAHLLHNRPARLLLVSTGNISNRELEALVVPSSRTSSANSRRTRLSNWVGRGLWFAGKGSTTQRLGGHWAE